MFWLTGDLNPPEYQQASPQTPFRFPGDVSLSFDFLFLFLFFYAAVCQSSPGFQMDIFKQVVSGKRKTALTGTLDHLFFWFVSSKQED